MDSGSVIIRARQRNGCIGMGLASVHAIVLFGQKLKEILLYDIAIILAQLINLLIGITPVRINVIFLLCQTQKAIQSGSFVGTFVQ